MESEEVLAREIRRIDRDDQRTAAVDIVNQVDKLRELMPDKMRPQAHRLALRALVYCREKITVPIDPSSFVIAVMEAAEFGLAIDGRLAHAIPFDHKDSGGVRKLHFLPDYKGMIAVAKWRGVLKDAYARVVRKNDDFRMWEDEEGSHFRFEQLVGGERGGAIGAFCVLHFPDDRRRCEFMPEEDIQKVRAVAKTQRIWNLWEDEMRKKAACRRAMKLCQDDPQVSDLLEADNKGYELDQPIQVQALDLDADTAAVAPPTPPQEPRTYVKGTESGGRGAVRSPAPPEEMTEAKRMDVHDDMAKGKAGPPRRSRRRRPGPPPAAPDPELSPEQKETMRQKLILIYQRGWMAMHEEGEDPSVTLEWQYEVGDATDEDLQARIGHFSKVVKERRASRGGAGKQDSQAEAPAPRGE